MRDFIVSAGKKRKLYDMPAEAPARACCHRGSGGRSFDDSEVPIGETSVFEPYARDGALEFR